MAAGAGALLAAAVLTGCAHPRTTPGAAPPPVSTPASRPAQTATASSTSSATAPSGTAAPPATASTTPAPSSTSPGAGARGVPAFVATVNATSSADLHYSYRAGCPVGPDQLRRLTLSYWGFDQAPHLGTLIVNNSVTRDVIKIFATLYSERFPIRQMQPVDAFKGSDPASMAADNTSGFNCRDAVAPGPPQWSVHAYGEAVDVNTIENPYVEGGVVQPPAGSGYLNRAVVRPGMAVPGGPLVDAFASVGWLWGGRWSSPDYQHFSKTGG